MVVMVVVHVHVERNLRCWPRVNIPCCVQVLTHIAVHIPFQRK